ncbi:MAG: 4Fe-4S binding protein [Deltaproteobacteria bacterium]|nr:4Fe-4S binding protein [Deltaproteobacteria bacterium]
MSIPRALSLVLFSLALLAAPAASVARPALPGDAPPPAHLDCAALPCADVLPGAVRFDAAAPGRPFAIGRDATGAVVGWVALSTELVDIKAYSGKPMVTLIGVDSAAAIAGAKVLHHSEPILLVGIPEQKLTDFVDAYRGLDVRTRVIFGHSDEPGVHSVDAISGATVTALAQNQTILEVARKIAIANELMRDRPPLKGHWIEEPAPWTFAQMQQRGVFGRLVVRDREMGLPGGGEGVYLDLWFTIADAPQIGRGLLPAGDYDYLREQLQPGDHIVVMLGAGKTSFKGSGFVRGGLFDRVRLEQDMRTIVFSDADYLPLQRAVAADAPGFTEAAVFLARGSKLDPGRPFELVFVGSRYTGESAFERDFHAFPARHRMPGELYVLDEPEPAEDASVAEPGWKMAWSVRPERVVLLSALLLWAIALFAGRRFTTGTMARLRWLHRGTMLASATLVGFWLHAQPSVTQLLTLVGAAVHEWRWSLFLSDPALFLLWCFIALVTVIWGRGVFCGWVCPYGALHEATFWLGQRVGLPEFELPERWHLRLRNLRYGVLLVLVAAYLYSPELGERMAEVEPFKSTFFVAPWTRHAGLFAWWLLLAVAGLFTFRPFCRYLCPLGAALALPGWLRISGPYRRNYCQSCTICTKTCEPRAIDSKGRIEPRECLSCMECEANYRDPQTCPPLVALDRLDRSTKATAIEAELQAAVDRRRKAEQRAAPWKVWPR